jgi:transcriptional regulator with XRE-family HTH domain
LSANPIDHTPDPIDIAVGSRVRMRRKMLKVSQQALAQALGVTFQQVQKYERGANRVSASMLVKIARRLDCSVASLIGEEAGVVSDGLAARLAAPGALEVLDAYVKIPDARVRRRFLNLAVTLAGGEVSAEDEEALVGPLRPVIEPPRRRGAAIGRRGRLRHRISRTSMS